MKIKAEVPFLESSNNASLTINDISRSEQGRNATKVIRPRAIVRARRKGRESERRYADCLVSPKISSR